MINEKELSLLRYLTEKCPDSNFKILDAEEILEGMKDDSITKAELLELITNLNGRDAIQVKLSSLDEYCLTSLPKSKVLIDEYEFEKTVKENIQNGKTVEAPAEEPVVEEEIEGLSKRKKRKIVKNKQSVQVIKQQISVNYKKLFWTAFGGAFCGGGIIGLIFMIIMMVRG